MELTRKSKIALVIMLVGAFVSSLSQSLLTSALPSIMTEYTVSATIGQWLTTIYILILGIITAITAFLIDKYNTNKLFISAMAIFLIGCTISMLAPNFPILLFSRVLQACGAGIMAPLFQVVALNTFPVKMYGKVMGVFGFVISSAPAIGPTLSGILVDFWGWRSIFYLLAAISVLLIGTALFSEIDNISKKVKGKMDFFSALIYGLGFCSLMLGVTNQESYGFFHYLTITPILIGILCLYIFTRRQLKTPLPLLQLRILTNKTFTVTTILVIMTYLILMSGTILVPIYIQSVRGLSAITSGLVLLPGSLLVCFMNPITGYIFG